MCKSSYFPVWLSMGLINGIDVCIYMYVCCGVGLFVTWKGETMWMGIASHISLNVNVIIAFMNKKKFAWRLNSLEETSAN